MNCTASFQLMSNMGFTRNFAPQREKNLQQENQCPPIRLNGYELTPFPCYWIIYLLCVSPSTFHPEDVLIICQCQLEILGQGGLTGFKLDLTRLKLKVFTLFTPSDKSLPCQVSSSQFLPHVRPFPQVISASLSIPGAHCCLCCCAVVLAFQCKGSNPEVLLSCELSFFVIFTRSQQALDQLFSPGPPELFGFNQCFTISRIVHPDF